MALFEKLIGPNTPELSFDMFFSLLLKKGIFSKKRPTDCNPNSFWIVAVQEWPKTSAANTYCPLGTIDFSNIVDIDNLLVKNSKKKFCIFANKRVKLAKNGSFNYRALSAEVEVGIAPF